jgi:hypothetical protein
VKIPVLIILSADCTLDVKVRIAIFASFYAQACTIIDAYVFSK